MQTKKIAVIGAGTMGSTIIAGLLRTGNSSVENITATTRSDKSALKIHGKFGVRVLTDNQAAASGR